MKAGDRVKILREKNLIYGEPHRYFGKLGTVREIDSSRVCVVLDDYPNVNWRDYHNRYWYGKEEVEVVEGE